MSSRLFLPVLSASVVLVGCASNGGDLASEVETGSTASVSGGIPTTETHTGPLVSSSMASCVEAYTAPAVAGRSFAFDGTVVNITDGTTNRPSKGRINLAGVTFAIDTWYVAGATSTVTIDMAPPSEGFRLDEIPPTYGVGTRLLVSGESRWGEGALQDGLAWGCGFTRYYDAETADEWRAATE